MAEPDKKHPGDLETSLYTRVEASLRCLSPEVRQQVRGLGVFHGGAHVWVLGQVIGVDHQTAVTIGRALVEVGLAEEMPYGHLRFDPALASYLVAELTEAEQEQARSLWAVAMQRLAAFLYQQQFQDVELSARLTPLELHNLMACLDWVEQHVTAEGVVKLAYTLESLLADLGHPRALAQATRARERAAARLDQHADWSHTRYLAEDSKIDRLIEAGRLLDAREAARHLLERCLAAGEGAHPEAAYNIAAANFKLGRALQVGGAAEAALAPLAEAQRRFQVLADGGSTDAAKMASKTIAETANCLADLGRFDNAAAAYAEAIRRAEQLDERRQVAVVKGQLGTVRILQKRYREALEAHSEARAIFESLGEPRSVATAWHEIGIVHKEAGRFEQAESAYRESLAIEVREKDFASEAVTLSELGSLYRTMGHLEAAVKCYRQAADICARLEDKRQEGLVCDNLAVTLIKLERYEEARRELTRAIECKMPYGQTATPWTTWGILHDLERAASREQAAAEARRQAIECYLAYRRDGGQSYDVGAQTCVSVTEVIESGDRSATAALAQELAKTLQEYSGTEYFPRVNALLTKLQAILSGGRDPALGDDPELFYQDAVELRLLLESLGPE